MAIDGTTIRNSTISAASSVQTWTWDKTYQSFFIQNLTAGTNTAVDTVLYFDTIATITTSSTTAIQLHAGQTMEMYFSNHIESLYFYSTATLDYQVFPI